VYSRVTLLEIDTLRVDLESALELFRDRVLPKLREQEGYEGVYVLTTPEGKALIMSLWETEEAAAEVTTADRARFYDEQLEQYTTLFSAPPGRERYEVALADLPTVV
jgi:heme-degrading monooxygenase HmoA